MRVFRDKVEESPGLPFLVIILLGFLIIVGITTCFKFFSTHIEKKEASKFKNLFPSDVKFSQSFFLEFKEVAKSSELDLSKKEFCFLSIEHSEIMNEKYNFSSYTKSQKEILEEIIYLVTKGGPTSISNNVWYYQKDPNILSCVVLSYSADPETKFGITHYNIVTSRDWSEYRHGLTFY